MIRQLAFAACAGFLIAASSPAHADKRVALVVGNSAYQNVSPLPNPARDAAAIAKMFTLAGFDVVTAKTDLGNLDFKRALREFTFAAKDADIAAVYFAGHGIEVKGTNYLIPIDAKLASDYDADDEAVSMNRIVESLESVKRLRLVILDACRNNPFNKTMQRMIATRAVNSGLAKVEPQTSNTLIAFAAREGSTADDGNGTNSPFTAALLKHLPVPGRDIRIAFGYVRDEVMAATNQRQEPFVYGSLGGTALALVAAREPHVVEEANATPTDPNAGLRRDYELAERVGTKEAWDFFLAAHRSGFYADLATAQRSKILAAEKATVDANAAKAKADAAARATSNAGDADKSKALAEAQKAQADAAEKARLALAAERAKVEVAEKARAEAAARTQADSAERARLAKAFEEARAEVERLKAEIAKTQSAAAERTKTGNVQIAAVPPPATPGAAPDAAKLALPADLSRSLQTELRRVGCNVGSIENDWTANARRSLENFNKHAGMKLDAKVASHDAFEAVKAKSSRVCPLSCERGYRAQGETCVAIACKAGFFVNDDNECEKKEDKTKAATRTSPKEQPAAKTTAKENTTETKSSSGGAVHCNRTGCTAVKSISEDSNKPLQPGCARENSMGGGFGSSTILIVCR